MAGLDPRTGGDHLHASVSPWSWSAWAPPVPSPRCAATRSRSPSRPTTLVDTVGAGDSFHAGLLHDLAQLGVLGGRLDTLTAGDLEQALRFASRVAAITCSRPGADPPWRAEVE